MIFLGIKAFNNIRDIESFNGGRLKVVKWHYYLTFKSKEYYYFIPSTSSQETLTRNIFKIDGKPVVFEEVKRDYKGTHKHFSNIMVFFPRILSYDLDMIEEGNKYTPLNEKEYVSNVFKKILKNLNCFQIYNGTPNPFEETFLKENSLPKEMIDCMKEYIK